MENHIYTTPSSIVCYDEETAKVVWQLNIKQVAALREAGEKMAKALQDVLHDRPSAHTDNVWENINAAIEAWEAANK